MLLVLAAASEVADFAVAGGTAALAIATFLMAWSARKQAADTRRLAQASERQVAWMAQQGIAATIPSLHIKLVGDRVVVSADQRQGYLRAVYTNHGQVTAEITAAQTEAGQGGASISPLQPREETFIEVPDTAMGSGPERTIEVFYRSVHGGPGNVVRTRIQSLGSDQWGLLEEKVEILGLPT